MSEGSKKRITQIYAGPARTLKRGLDFDTRPERLKKAAKSPIITHPESRELEGHQKGTKDIPVSAKSPWDEHKKLYQAVDFQGCLIVAVRKAAPRTIVHIRQLRESAEKSLFRAKQYRHPNLVAVSSVFTTPEGSFFVSEIVHIALQNIARCPEYPDQRQFAAIISQVCALRSMVSIR